MENQRIGVNQTRYVVNSQPALSQVLVKEENGVKTFYVYGLGLIGEEIGSEYRSYHFDYRGSTVALTDQTGKVVQRFQYGPYGELVKGEVTQTPFLFNGKFGVMTDDNGLYYMRARFYSAEMKRFVNMDMLLGSVGEGQTLNRFAFVTGRPISFVDPLGLELSQFHEIYWWIHKNYPELTHRINGQATAQTTHQFDGKTVTTVTIAANPIIDFLQSLGYDVDGFSYGDTAVFRKCYIDYTLGKGSGVVTDEMFLTEENLMNTLVHELLHLYVNNKLGGTLNYIFSSKQKEYHEWVYLKTSEITIYWLGYVPKDAVLPTLTDFPK